MHVTKADVDAVKRAWGLLPQADNLPKFNIRPISEAWRWSSRRPAYRTATANAAYIWRDASPVDRFGPMPSSFEQRRFELRASGLLLPSSAPQWAAEGYRIWEDVDRVVAAADDPTAVAAWHVVMEIPVAMPAGRWRQLVTDFVYRELIARGAVVAWAIHALEADHGWLVAPHAHLIVTARRWRHDGRHGNRNVVWAGNWGRQKALEMAWRRVSSHTIGGT